MKLANKVLSIAFIALALCLTVVTAQTKRLEKDNRNIAPTVGTGGAIGGPTGLFTVYDGQTLRRGEYTFSVAYSNYDRDPGNVDITEVPVSFQIGLNDYIELFFNTDAFRGVKVNAPRNLSSFYLPNTQLRSSTGAFAVPGALVLGPSGTGLVFRGSQPFTQFPFVGGRFSSSSAVFGSPRASTGGGADLFPGIGSIYGSILPGVVFRTTPILGAPGVGVGFSIPTSFALAPSYLPDAPFIGRQYGTSAFGTYSLGAKWRFTKPENPVGVGIIPFLRLYGDKATDNFNQLQRGASPGGSRGDVGVIAFADARVSEIVNVSANIGFTRNSSVKADFPSGKFTLLDRPDEFTAAIGVDFPVNKFFQPIAELRGTKYVGGRTPNAFEQNPIDAIVGARVHPTRWMSIGAWYRYNVNQQDPGAFDESLNANVTIPGTGTFQSVTGGVPTGFGFSNDPHGGGFQVTAGRRNARFTGEKENTPPVVSVATDGETVTIGCPPGQVVVEGTTCDASASVGIRTTATDADGDTLLYKYAVSGGRITGDGANVGWDLSGAQPGTYSVTVEVDDGCGCVKPITKTVTVKACECREPPIRTVCPTNLEVSVTPAEPVDAGQELTFTATLTQGTDTPTYNWTVSAGTILEGQGTPLIKVSTDGRQGSSITATVELGGIDPSCRNTASATGDVKPGPRVPEVRDDSVGFKANNDIKKTNDGIAEQLPSDNTIVIIAYGSRKGGAREAQRKLDFIKNDLVNRKGIEASRITTKNGGVKDTLQVTIYFVPPGATEPQP